MNKTRQIKTRSEDARLLESFVVNKDEDAFRKLVSKYESLVWNICCRILKDRCDAEDAFQATFLLLATRAHRIRKPKSLSSWLYGVAFRTASSMRKQRHRDLLPMENFEDSRLENDVLEQVAKKNENELVSAELMLLQEQYRTPLLMFYFLGQSCNQIANALQLSNAAVESRLRQARMKLKQRLRLKGIDMGVSCAVLAVPVMAISPSLASTTVSGVMSASVARGLEYWISNVTSTFQHSGAKLMLMKTAVSFGLIGILTVGFVTHGVNGAQGVTTIVGMSGISPQLPIKFVSEDDEDDSDETHSFHDIHQHVYSVWKNITSKFRGQEPEVRVGYLVDLSVASSEDQENDGTQGQIIEVDLESAPLDQQYWTYRVVRENTTDESEKDSSQSVTFNVVTDRIEQSSIPFLGDIPVIGHLFKPVQETFEFELREAEDSDQEDE